MPKINPFRGIRPAPAMVSQVVVRPFDRFGTEEAKAILASNPSSFLHVIEPSLKHKYLRASQDEAQYIAARESFEHFLQDKILIQDAEPSLYVYRVTRDGISQTGIWACSMVDDYLNNTIKKHELTRADREEALINYLDCTGVDANPVLVTYKTDAAIDKILDKTVLSTPIYNFTTEQIVQHELWQIADYKTLNVITTTFAAMPCAYIADGHHRAASASLLGMRKRMANLRHNGTEDYNYFTSLYFSAPQMVVYEFNRLVKDLNGLSLVDYLKKISTHFEVTKSTKPVQPTSLHSFGLYVNNEWYSLKFKKNILDNNPVKALDVSILQDYILEPIHGIKDARTDNRIDFEGGIKGLEPIVNRVNCGEMKVGFTLFPTSMEELFSVADAGEVMPPKSTWFEPKLHCGLLTHRL